MVYVSETGLVQNKVIEGAPELGQRELEQISNYLNHELTGMCIHDVREKISRELQDERSRYDQLQKQALSLSSVALQEEAED